MSKFSTHLSLGQTAYGVERVSYRPDHKVVELTVGQIRVTETSPKHRAEWDTTPLFHEEYMCTETGVGSGTVWEYGKNIFATEADAKAGAIAHDQRAYKEQAAHDARQAEQRAEHEARERRELQRLTEKYERAGATS